MNWPDEAVPAAVAADLSGFGGILRCTTCGHEQPLGDIATHFRDGWPKCCGLTMTWVTQRLLDEETGNSAIPPGGAP